MVWLEYFFKHLVVSNFIATAGEWVKISLNRAGKL